MAKLINYAKNAFQETVFVLLSILIICLYPIIFLGILVLLTVRHVVKVVVTRDKKIGRIISYLDAVYLAHTTYSSPTCTVVACYPVTSTININHVIAELQNKVIPFQDKNGNRLFIQMTQKVVRKFGYLFYKDVDNFQVADHVRHLNPSCPEELLDNRDIFDVTHVLSTMPFDSSRSPWEIVVAKNFKDSNNPLVKSIFFIRFHHGFMDGVSINRFVECMSESGRKILENELQQKSGYVFSTAQKASLFLTGPYYCVKLLLSNDTNKLATTARYKSTGKMVLTEGLSVPVSKLKLIKNHFNVNVSSVAISLMAEPMIEVLKQKNCNPTQISVAMPWPLLGHPGTITNHWITVKIPVVVGKGVVETLQNIDKEYIRMKSSMLPYALEKATRILGMLPTVLIPKSEGMISCTGLMSNFPVANRELTMFGYPVASIRFVASNKYGIPFVSCAAGYNGSLHFVVGGETCNLEQRDADLMANSLEHAYHEFLHMVERKFN